MERDAAIDWEFPAIAFSWHLAVAIGTRVLNSGCLNPQGLQLQTRGHAPTNFIENKHKELLPPSPNKSNPKIRAGQTFLNLTNLI